MNSLELIALDNFPLIEPNDNLINLIHISINENNLNIEDGDIFVIAQKIVSKSENRYIDLNTIEVTSDAEEMASKLNKHPGLIQLIMNESHKIISTDKNVIIVEHKLGYININAGIDQSNIPQDKNLALLLPENPTKSAENLQKGLSETFNKDISIIISDSMTRPYRSGITNFAISSSNLPSLLDLKGKKDMYGNILRGTEVAIADELAAAAGLLMGQSKELKPVILIKGFIKGKNDINNAFDLIVNENEDMYR
tara:strand:- start:1005 stop:1766 length:762 start_codon:yes stop_codon:yes gene_type:complete